MEYGHVVISNNKKGFVPKAIRFFTKSRFSHSFLVAPPMHGFEMGLEAANNGVVPCLFDKDYRQNPDCGYRVYRFRADPAAKDAALKLAMLGLNEGYGYLELVWFMWRALNRWVGRDIRDQDNWIQAGTICSEYTARYISDAGFPHYFAGFGRGSIHAQDVLDVLEAHPETFELIETKE